MQDFRKLRVWHLSHEVADEVYKITAAFPTSQRGNLADQLERAADSVTHNISEGCGKATRKEKSHAFHISLGSINEVDNGLVRALRLHLVSSEVYDPLQVRVVDVRKMLISLIRKVENS